MRNKTFALTRDLPDIESLCRELESSAKQLTQSKAQAERQREHVIQLMSDKGDLEKQVAELTQIAQEVSEPVPCATRASGYLLTSTAVASKNYVTSCHCRFLPTLSKASADHKQVFDIYIASEEQLLLKVRWPLCCPSL